jgi:hypothetical protein
MPVVPTLVQISMLVSLARALLTLLTETPAFAAIVATAAKHQPRSRRNDAIALETRISV